MCRSIKNPVHFNETGFLIEFVLYFTALADFDNSIETVGSNALRAYIVPNISHNKTNLLVKTLSEFSIALKTKFVKHFVTFSANQTNYGKYFN